MLYADVILPLPVEGFFTYSIPASLQERDLWGCRVLVPFGRTKTYTALVVKSHNIAPPFAVKALLSVLDDKPILLRTQYKLWEWMSDYYLSPLGDVYKAALPAGLKAEEGYRPRTETYVALAPKFCSAEAIDIAKNILSRADKQLKTFNHYLTLSRWSEIIEGETGEEMYASESRESEALVLPSAADIMQPLAVTRDELINAAHSTLPIVKALCNRGILTTYKREVGRLSNSGEARVEKIKPLSRAQLAAFNSIEKLFTTKPTVLLHGVTSSGKTEIYIHLIEKAIERGEQVLYLLPEIALTVQIMQRLQSVFGNKLGIYHSRYSDAERVEIWQKQLSDEPYQVILGARSAVFLPFRKLGLVIVDEEHEGSFKQAEPAPRYHARSTALMLAQMSKAKTLLGTATPSMESFFNAKKGKYGLVALTTRFKGMEMPKIEVVDVRDLRRRKMMNGNFSPQLSKAIRQALDEEKQVILFHNRRGYSRQIECKTCGWVPRCTNCDVALTLHRTSSLLICHYCGYTFPIPDHCPACEGKDLLKIGMGTEKIEDEILANFPDAKVARMDLDSTRSHNAYDRILGDFSAGRTNILVGTQMVTKGLDFDRVAVVGVLDADTLLNNPDFRAYENAFQMLSQVSGRAGRKGERGRVFLQTKNANLIVLQQVVSNDYAAFYEETERERRFFNYPPYSHLVRIVLHHRYDKTVERAAQYLASLLRAAFADRVLGPDKPAVGRIKQQHIRTILLKVENKVSLARVRPLLKQARNTLLQDKSLAAVTLFFDVDPL